MTLKAITFLWKILYDTRTFASVTLSEDLQTKALEISAAETRVSFVRFRSWSSLPFLIISQKHAAVLISCIRNDLHCWRAHQSLRLFRYILMNTWETISTDRIMFTDKLTEGWLLTSTPYPVITILAVYLLFVLKIGPWFMAHKNPYVLKTVMRVYNIVQVLYNLHVLLKGVSIKYGLKFKYLYFNIITSQNIDERKWFTKKSFELFIIGNILT